jgi:hypothetical protein
VLKYAGIIKEGQGGKWATGANIVIAALLTFVVQVFDFDLSGDLAAQLTEIAGLVGQLVIALLGSNVSHYLSKRMSLYNPVTSGAIERRGGGIKVE